MVRDARTLGLLVVALAVALAAWSAFGPRGLAHLRRLDGEATRIEAANQDLATENAALIRRIDALRHDKATLESVARNQLGLVRPGEVVFRFVPEKPGAGR